MGERPRRHRGRAHRRRRTARLSFVAVGCADLEHSGAFYRALGFREVARFTPAPDDAAHLRIDGPARVRRGHARGARGRRGAPRPRRLRDAGRRSRAAARPANTLGMWRARDARRRPRRTRARQLAERGVATMSAPVAMEMGPGLPALRFVCFAGPDARSARAHRAAAVSDVPVRVLRPSGRRRTTRSSTRSRASSPTSTTAAIAAVGALYEELGIAGRRARSHGLVGVALPSRARAPHRARHERGRARRESAGGGRGSCTTSTRTRCSRSPTTRSTTRPAASRSTTSPVRSTCSARSRGSLRPGGRFVCTFSNRLFPTKAVRGWLFADNDTHVDIVREYFASVRRLRTRRFAAAHATRQPRRPAVRASGPRCDGDCTGIATHTPGRTVVCQTRSRVGISTTIVARLASRFSSSVASSAAALPVASRDAHARSERIHGGRPGGEIHLGDRREVGFGQRRRRRAERRRRVGTRHVRCECLQSRVPVLEHPRHRRGLRRRCPTPTQLSGNVGWVIACWNTVDAAPRGVARHASNASSASRPSVTTASTS